MTSRLSGHICIFGWAFFVRKSLLGIARQWSREKFAILSPEPRIHDRILFFRTSVVKSMFLKVWWRIFNSWYTVYKVPAAMLKPAFI